MFEYNLLVFIVIVTFLSNKYKNADSYTRQNHISMTDALKAESRKHNILRII